MAYGMDGEWGEKEWGKTYWGGAFFGSPPNIIPVYPTPGISDVLPSTYLEFIVADPDTNIDLTNTTVHVLNVNTGVGANIYAAGAFIGGWAAESTTTPYNGVYGRGYTFSCRNGPLTWGNNILWEITVDTQDLDIPAPNTNSLSWRFRSVKAMYVTDLEQVCKDTLLATFTNQVADTTTAPENASPNAVRMLTFDEFQMGTVLGRRYNLNQVGVKKITRNIGLYPDQLMIHIAKMTGGIRYAVVFGSYDPITGAVPVATDLVDIYGQRLGAGSAIGTYDPLFLGAQDTVADRLLNRLRGVSFDLSENSNVSGIMGAVATTDDGLGGSGTSRIVSRV